MSGPPIEVVGDGVDPADSNALSPMDFLARVHCPSCSSPIMPPIFQCPKGHLLCRGCHMRRPVCPVCFQRMGYIRNRALEQIGGRLRMPCQHAGYGCNASLGYTDKHEHEMKCSYRPDSCPYTVKCKWQAPRSAHGLQDHLRSDHLDISWLEAEQAQFVAKNVNCPEITEWGMVLSCHAHSFLVALSKVDMGNMGRQFNVAVTQLDKQDEEEEEDDDKDAKGFYIYEVNLRECSCQIRWRSRVNCVPVDPYSEMANSCEMLITDYRAELFIRDGDLSMPVKIIKFV